MSFWDDDFYSTKANRRSRSRGWRRYPRESWGKRNPLALAYAVSAAALLVMFGMALMIYFLIRAPMEVNTAGVQVDKEDQVIWASEKVKPAVVSIISTKPTNGDPPQEGQVLGSGVIFERDQGKAKLVTNQHVVDGAGQIDVVLPSGKKERASVIGEDKLTDLAILEMNGQDIGAVAEFGDSDGLKAGETAIAIGNPLGLEFSQTITVGVISSPHRVIPVSLGGNGNIDWRLDVIQTDAAINQGNSGGALVNLQGKVIGINSRKIADTGVEGLGFAIPINLAKPIIDELVRYGEIQRPHLGIYPQDLQSFSSGTEVLKLPKTVKTGIIVMEVTGPSKSAGLRHSDVIVALDDQTVNNTVDLRKYLYENKRVGDKGKVTFYRNGERRSVVVSLRAE
ncbi:S1C family serine protease [Ferviditalea candida]|uniref:Trypsin-like peptidase domain-containing protein n=1 Tax=Ferviditalea candida TaxID=3108399 RepID=A0ABU5ZLZ5_9BACL|nr:trypsin-like peptidase domain-containing protein [Paenibacillaceae bacterium T2]